MMGIATTCIGLLPVYTQIGIWAPISLVALRIVQGIAVGGEWGGAILIASESAPKGKGILYAAFAQQGSPTGNLLATWRSSPSAPCPPRTSFSGAGARRSCSPQCWSSSAW